MSIRDISAVVNQLGVDRRLSAKLVRLMFDEIQRLLLVQGRVLLPGVGRLDVVPNRRPGRHRPGLSAVQSRSRVRFVVSRGLKQRLELEKLGRVRALRGRLPIEGEGAVVVDGEPQGCRPITCQDTP